jgi:hypothetical protein
MYLLAGIRAHYFFYKCQYDDHYTSQIAAKNVSLGRFWKLNSVPESSVVMVKYKKNFQ